MTSSLYVNGEYHPAAWDHIVTTPKANYKPVIGGDTHNYQRSPVCRNGDPTTGDHPLQGQESQKDANRAHAHLRGPGERAKRRARDDDEQPMTILKKRAGRRKDGPDMSWRKAGKAAGGALVDSVREWMAIVGGLGAGLAAGLLIWQGGAGSVPGIVCLVLAAGGLVAAFFGMRDRDLGGWAGAIIALMLGIATFVAFALATGT